jgi:hypothetical protein
LRDGPRGFPRGSTCPGVLGYQIGCLWVSNKGLSPAMAGLSRPFFYPPQCHVSGPTTPHRPKPIRFGLVPFRSPLLRESRFLSSPTGTEMFQFPAFASTCLCIQHGIPAHDRRWVSPFGHLRIFACSRLPGAFRSVPRPSSPPGAKASTVSPS